MQKKQVSLAMDFQDSYKIGVLVAVTDKGPTVFHTCLRSAIATHPVESKHQLCFYVESPVEWDQDEFRKEFATELARGPERSNISLAFFRVADSEGKGATPVSMWNSLAERARTSVNFFLPVLDHTKFISTNWSALFIHQLGKTRPEMQAVPFVGLTTAQDRNAYTDIHYPFLPSIHLDIFERLFHRSSVSVSVRQATDWLLQMYSPELYFGPVDTDDKKTNPRAADTVVFRTDRVSTELDRAIMIRPSATTTTPSDATDLTMDRSRINDYCEKHGKLPTVEEPPSPGASEKKEKESDQPDTKEKEEPKADVSATMTTTDTVQKATTASAPMSTSLLNNVNRLFSFVKTKLV